MISSETVSRFPVVAHVMCGHRFPLGLIAVDSVPALLVCGH